MMLVVSEPVLRCVGLCKRYDDRVVVDHVGFEIGPGETYGLLGPNGAGKTTTISMVCGLLRGDGGEVVVAGHPLRGEGREVKRHLGYVPQEVALYPDLTAAENLRFFGRLQGLSGGALAARVAASLELVGLADRAGDKVETYSGGMKRRVNIAAGLLHQPRLLVLDEPTVGVDPQSRNAILDAVAGLGAEGMAVLYTTHYMEEAERLCDRIGILDEGRLVAEGTRRQLVERIGRRDRVRLDTAEGRDRLAAAVRAVTGVAEVTERDGGLDLLVDGARSLLPHLFEAAERAHIAVTSVQVEEPDLEAVFLHLTGRALRDT
jgi:ABC-2 type transport system ATP-binding protein